MSRLAWCRHLVRWRGDGVSWVQHNGIRRGGTRD